MKYAIIIVAFVLLSLILCIACTNQITHKPVDSENDSSANNEKGKISLGADPFLGERFTSAKNEKDEIALVPDPLINETETNAKNKSYEIRLEQNPSAAIEAEQQVWRKNSANIISEVKAEMADKGWGNVAAVEGELDSSQWGELILKPTEEEKNMFLYSVSGQIDGMNNNPITVVVKIIFGSEAPEGKRGTTFYVSASGRYMSSVSYDILLADDKELWDYMYSY